jgi:uncharacterized protein YbbC (DUF1343 family)
MLACAFEGTNVSVGRGTEKQFQIYGSPICQSNFSFVPKPNMENKKSSLQWNNLFWRRFVLTN